MGKARAEQEQNVCLKGHMRMIARESYPVKEINKLLLWTVTRVTLPADNF